VELTERFAMAALMEVRTPGGRVSRDGFPANPVRDGLMPLTLEPPSYPVCAVNRNGETPGSVTPGEVAQLELSGFGHSGPAAIWLGDGPAPVGSVMYHELGCAWPWITELHLPEDIEPGLHVVQVAIDGSGLTADCGVLVGNGEPPDWDAA
jgi:hypothetical protein